MIKEFSKFLGVVACFLSLHVGGVYGGFLSCSTVCDIRYPMISGSWWSHLDPYFAYHEDARLAIIALIIFLIGRLVKYEWLSHLICLVSLSVAIVTLLGQINNKYGSWDENDLYLSVARELFNYEVAIGVIAVLLLMLEVIMMLQHFAGRTISVTRFTTEDNIRKSEGQHF